MAAIQRPVKEGSVRTYQEKVGLGFLDILASEMDGDLDTVYAAWNGGVDSVTLKDGAVTTPKLVDLNVTTAKLADLAITPAKIAKGGSLFGPGGTAADTSNLTIPAAVTFIKELSITVDAGRPVLMLLRASFNVTKASTAGILGASF